MIFEYPNILYALLLLLIPIIIHLVRWKKYKQQVFTNVDFLKDLEIKSRKSRRLKELLVLLTRLLTIAALVLAFAKPYKNSKAQSDRINQTQNIIYLDNSLSMDAMRDNTNLWQNFIQDLQQNLPNNTTYTLLTNKDIYRNVSRKNLNLVLQQIALNGTATRHEQNLTKISYLVKNQQNTLTNVLYCSDMQNLYNENLNDVIRQQPDIQYYFLTRHYPDLQNISIDSIRFVEKTADAYEFNLRLSANNHQLKSPVTIRHNNEILWRGYVDFKDSLQQNLKIHLALKQDLEAVVKLHDKGFQFDNALYFTYHTAGKIKVLVLGNELPAYLKKIYTSDEFQLDLKQLNKLNINSLQDYDLIVLNHNDIPSGYTNALNQYIAQYGNLLIIPSYNKADALQNLLNNLHIRARVQLDTSEVFLNRICYQHPLFKHAFTKQVRNFAYPFVKQHYRISPPGECLYKLSDQSLFAQVFKRKGQIFVINTPIDSQNTDFEQAASLIVTLFYQIGKARDNRQNLYYIIGAKNTWQVPVALDPDETIQLTARQESFVPYQVNQYKQVQITTDELPEKNGIYNIMYHKQKAGSVAYNYNRKENLMDFLEVSENEHVHHISSINNFVSQQQAYFKSQSMWQWFLGLALLFLLIEMLLIRYWK